MATIVNTPGATDSGAGAAAWVTGLIVLAAVVLIGLFVWPGFARTTSAPSTNINVQVPTPDVGGNSN